MRVDFSKYNLGLTENINEQQQQKYYKKKSLDVNTCNLESILLDVPFLIAELNLCCS